MRALGLIAAQDVPVLVHSNLDDGFAASFHDLCCALGMAIVEKHIITKLCRAHYTVCYGHHFADPVTRTAFQHALKSVPVCFGAQKALLNGCWMVWIRRS